MARSVQWRKKVSDSCCWHQTQALDSTLYILRQTGPTGFLLQEEGEAKPVKVFLGDPHTCTCSVFKKEHDLCKHICWLLLRKFRLPVNDPMSWQLALVEREINEILQGKVTSGQNRAKQHQRSAKVIESSDGRTIVEQREIANDDVCPICQEELLSKKLIVTYCKYGCGNSIHIKCMQVWAEHQLKTSEDSKIKCPMCREDFGPFDLLKTEMKNAGYIGPSAPGIRLDRHVGVACSNCRVAPIEGKCYRCTVCPEFFLCQRCFLLPLHTDHSFQFKQKRNQRWHSASRALGSGLPSALVNDLMHREISENDYDLLLQLERNSQADLSRLSEEALQSIPVERVKEMGPLLAIGCQCRVCLRGFLVGQYVRKLPCKHKFHKDCIDSWLLHSHPTCPIDGLLAVPNQAVLPSSQRSAPQTRTTNNDQSQFCNQGPGGLMLTAFGIPIASSRLAAAQKSGVNLDVFSNQRTCQHPHSAIRLELSGLPFGHRNPPKQMQKKEIAELPEQRILHQAFEHRDRISQQVRKMKRTVSTAPTSCDLLPPDALVQYLQSGLPSRPMTTAADEYATHNNTSVLQGSVSSLSPAKGPVSQMTQNHPFQRRPRSLPTHQRFNSIERRLPSIKNVREVVGDLFLGNSPTTQPAVRENWITSKPLVDQRSRTRVFKSVFHNYLPSLNRSEGSRKMNIRLDGSAIEYNADHDHQAGDS